MGWVDEYPYTNFHELNLDYILTKMRELIDEWASYKNAMDLKFDNLSDEFDALKDFVNDYFDNLNVEDVIRDQYRSF